MEVRKFLLAAMLCLCVLFFTACSESTEEKTVPSEESISETEEAVPTEECISEAEEAVPAEESIGETEEAFSDGCYRCCDDGFYVEYFFQNDGTFSFDMVETEEIDGFDRDYGSGKYTIDGNVLTLTFYDGDYPGDTVVYTFEQEDDMLRLYFEDEVFEFIRCA